MDRRFWKYHIWTELPAILSSLGTFCRIEKMAGGGVTWKLPISDKVLHPFITPLILDQLTCSLPKNLTTFHEEHDGIIHFCLSPYKMGVFGTLNLRFGKKKWIFPNLIFQLHPIITQLILNQFACSLPKTNTTFHQLFKYAKKDATFSSIIWENSRNIFGRRYLRSTVICFILFVEFKEKFFKTIFSI